MPRRRRDGIDYSKILVELRDRAHALRIELDEVCEAEKTFEHLIANATEKRRATPSADGRSGRVTPRRRASPSKGAPKPRTGLRLVDHIVRYLRKRPKASSQAIAAGILSAGYETASKNPVNLVQVCLASRPEFVRSGKNEWVLSTKGRAAAKNLGGSRKQSASRQPKQNRKRTATVGGRKKRSRVSKARGKTADR